MRSRLIVFEYIRVLKEAKTYLHLTRQPAATFGSRAKEAGTAHSTRSFLAPLPTTTMRVLVLSVATGSCVFFQDLGQPPHGDPSALEGGAELAAKLHRMNALVSLGYGHVRKGAAAQFGCCCLPL